MATQAFEYEMIVQTKACDHGRHHEFDNVDVKVVGMHEEDKTGKPGEEDGNFAKTNVCRATVSNVPTYSTHTVNTATIKTASKMMTQIEGGWPKEVDATETQDTTKWRTKQGKDTNTAASLTSLIETTKSVVNNNNTIDLFEHYFLNEEPDALVENLSVKTITMFKDCLEDANRNVSCIAACPDQTSGRFFVGYANLHFQGGSAKGFEGAQSQHTTSYIWDINERNTPVTQIMSQSPITAAAFQPKNPDLLCVGLYNGQVAYYDLRMAKSTGEIGKLHPCTSVPNPNPLGFSGIGVSPVGDYTSHYDPVYEIMIATSKTGTEFTSVSTDGSIKWWDLRNLGSCVSESDKTTKQLSLNTMEVNEKGAKTATVEYARGITSFEWAQEAGPTKWLLGLEDGGLCILNSKPKKPVDVGGWFGYPDRNGKGKHSGPVRCVRRNPFHPKTFMSVGDWTAKIWNEDLKGPLMTTDYADAFLTCGAWSPSRAGLMCVGRNDGWIDFWDYNYRMNQVSLSHKVTAGIVTTMNWISTPNWNQFGIAQGSTMLVGDSDGTVSCLQLCEGLYVPQPNEKVLVGQKLDHEWNREKNLEAGYKAKGQRKEDEILQAVEHEIDQKIADEFMKSAKIE